VAFAFSTMVYTGLLLGDSLPIPFWDTVLLPILFFVSALSTGLMALILVGTLHGGHDEAMAALARADIILIIVEILILAAYMHGSVRRPITQPAAQTALTGDLAPMFWGGVAFCGLAAPLCLEAAEIHGAGAVVAAALGLVGGLLLRYVVLAAGVFYGYTAAGFTFNPVNNPKMEMPDIGMVPPGNT